MNEADAERKANKGRRALLGGARVNALGTLVSRLLGMVRDMATASLLGMSSGGVMDAFALAFRIPNLFRRLFGEGAMTASYLPVFAQEYEKSPGQAWKLASVAAVLLGVVMLGFVLLGECVCLSAILLGEPGSRLVLVARLTAVMMPYALLICLAALAAATLHARNHFAAPALVPTLLNIAWILGAVALAPRWSDSPDGQALVLAECVLAAGFLQLGVQWPVLRAIGFRFDFDRSAARAAVVQVARGMVPMTLGLMVTQINTLMDSLLAWGLAAPATLDGARPTLLTCGATSIEYPLRQGAAAAVYFGERLYQFPLGVLGIAVATAVFPLLARHAARGDLENVERDLSFGLRLVLALGLPASVGLLLLGHPIATLLFERGQFTADDALRTGRMIAAYGLGVWAYCALPVLVRGFYAMRDWTTPVRIGAAAAVVNFTLNVSLIWPLGEMGLAVATSLAAMLQIALLIVAYRRRGGRLLSWGMGATALRAAIACGGMTIVAATLMAFLPHGDSLDDRLIRVAAPAVACLIAYVALYRALGGREISLLLMRGKADSVEEEDV